jgi:hypothetical protein
MEWVFVLLALIAVFRLVRAMDRNGEFDRKPRELEHRERGWTTDYLSEKQGDLGNDRD